MIDIITYLRIELLVLTAMVYPFFSLWFSAIMNQKNVENENSTGATYRSPAKHDKLIRRHVVVLKTR